MIWFVIQKTWEYIWVIKQLFPASIWLITLLHAKTTKQIWKHLLPRRFHQSWQKTEAASTSYTKIPCWGGAAVRASQLSHSCRRWECYSPELWAVQRPVWFPIPDTVKIKRHIEVQDGPQWEVTQQLPEVYRRYRIHDTIRAEGKIVPHPAGNAS